MEQHDPQHEPVHQASGTSGGKGRRLIIFASLAAGLLLVAFLALMASGVFGSGFNVPGTESADGFHPVFDGKVFAARGDIRIEGKPITSNEILLMIERDKPSWLAALEQEPAYQGSHEMLIAKNGYSLFNYDEHQVKRDVVWLPIFLDGKVVASVTAFRDGGQVSGSLSWGSPALQGSLFERFNAALAAHPRETLVYVSAGRFTECLITPDNQIITLNGNPPEVKNAIDWYHRFMTEYNVISASVLKDKGNFIALNPSDPGNAVSSDSQSHASSDDAGNAIAAEREVPITVALDQAVGAAILTKNGDNYFSGECAGEGHKILLAAESAGPSGQKLLKAYALCTFGTFEFMNGRLIVVGGNSLIPTVLTFNVESNGALGLIDYREPREGSELAPSVRELFPASVQQAVLNPGEDVRAELNRQRNAYAADYMQKLGRKNGVGDLSDFEDYFIPLSSLLSTSMSNSLLQEYGDYPAFVSRQGYFGDRERLENGTRTVFEVRWDSSGHYKGRLTFRRSVYDGDRVYSQVEYLVDGDDYRLVEIR